ncbi:MAG: Molybdopterin molybdenumtransferase (EC 2.10.1.1) [Olavius algarvensis Delta 4 endosymbiont]|nr:MAG: Molybdopterin molybdenumtransferase (EC 2.10.1.1) [Olavius algarvensis Delta 4 endosymbiont]
MQDFFKVVDIRTVYGHLQAFTPVDTEVVATHQATGRVLAEAIDATEDLPGFSRSTMDGYAVRAASSFGSSEANPAYLMVTGSVTMGAVPDITVGPGEAVRIATGGMLPAGADAVVMVEHTEEVDADTIEVYKSVAPGQHVILAGEDYPEGATVLQAGRKIRAAETGLLAAVGRESATVYRQPLITIISTGDEVIPTAQVPGPGQIRDINSYSLAGMVAEAGCRPRPLGIVRDNFEDLRQACRDALAQSDMVILSGGSSVGTRDFTIQVINSLPDSELLVHGISISPGKPTILASVGGKPVWGLPGHVVSAMVVFEKIVKPFINRIHGRADLFPGSRGIPARLTRNVPSAQGRVDFIRVRLIQDNDKLKAEPLLGKSGLINTMVQADGLIEIDSDTEGLDKDIPVSVIPI